MTRQLRRRPVATSYVWENLLLETGFLAAFLCPLASVAVEMARNRIDREWQPLLNPAESREQPR